MAKQLMFSEEARRGMLEGVTLLSKAVKATLGPKGRNVAIEKKYGAPTTMYGNKSRNSWDWVLGPWPWEHDAN